MRQEREGAKQVTGPLWKVTWSRNCARTLGTLPVNGLRQPFQMVWQGLCHCVHIVQPPDQRHCACTLFPHFLAQSPTQASEGGRRGIRYHVGERTSTLNTGPAGWQSSIRHGPKKKFPFSVREWLAQGPPFQFICVPGGGRVEANKKAPLIALHLCPIPMPASHIPAPCPHPFLVSHPSPWLQVALALPLLPDPVRVIFPYPSAECLLRTKNAHLHFLRPFGVSQVPQALRRPPVKRK